MGGLTVTKRGKRGRPLDSGPCQIETMESQKVKNNTGKKDGGHQTLIRVKIYIKKGWTPETRGEVTVVVTQISATRK